MAHFSKQVHITIGGLFGVNDKLCFIFMQDIITKIVLTI